MLAAAALLGAMSCDVPRASLVVDLVTNLRPSDDFDRAEVAAYAPAAPGAPPHATWSVAASEIEDPLDGFRLGELTALSAGAWLVEVRLMHSGDVIGSKRTIVDLDGVAAAVTMVVTGECAGVDCSEGPLTSCLAGRCVDPRCGPEAPTYCPSPECTADTECSVPDGAPLCTAPLCLFGFCSTRLDEHCLDAAIVEVDAGSAHTCARRGSGEVMCWGSNGEGQLGDGTLTDRPAPILVSELSDAVELAAGRSHTCARLAGGQVQCWGRNAEGQLGDGTNRQSSLPVTVQGLTDAARIGTGEAFTERSHTCALRASGELACWGSNDEGQLGDGTQTRRPSATSVVDLANVTDLAVGGLHTCAGGSGGEVWCWGYAWNGQLGNGDSGPNHNRSRPTSVVIDGPVRLMAGVSHTCALRPSGEVLCWGRNDEGQLGFVGAAATPTPVPGVADAIQLSAGLGHTCALLRSGDVLCWGDNSRGQLGGGTSPRSGPALVQIADVTELSGGYQHTCARTLDGEVRCWGANHAGQLGDGTTVDRPNPVLVAGLR